MNALWNYFWPVFAMGLVIGTVSLAVGYRRNIPRRALLIGAVISFAATGIWHGYAAPPFVAAVERTARQALEYYEMSQIEARLQQSPLSRDLLLSGQADDWQRGELVRLLSQVPGAGTARWTRNSFPIPVIAEAASAAAFGFLLGLLLAYLAEWHRRHNAQWSW